ncbi:MAG: hypothetical protein KI785_08970 [Devosiaceae bacterium]|nr:hypothetical protein [Devosiaceae bacterium MH13]
MTAHQPDQLILNIAPAPSYATEDFISGAANAEARLLASDLACPTPIGLIVGDAGSGKTHLAHIAAQELGPAAWLEPGVQTGFSLGGDAARVLVIDGLERWVGAHEDDVFHALEAARAAQVPTFVTAQSPPENLGLGRPDIISRLRAGARAHIAAPDDDLFTAIAVKLFTDRQLMVEQDIALYLLQRMERSYANLARLIALIDERSLAKGRSITKALAREVLDAFDLS